ncbi:MAG TPA: four helix bundle protein [Burkholderiales bacterium]|nr:four helix bundle protein [Burkholderiales bacterium]
MKSHKDLDVWKLAVDLAEQVYEATRGFPKEEQFGITAQMRRCGVSLAANIAEGAARQGKREYRQFLFVALGSASELETHLEIARRVGLLPAADFERLDALVARSAQMLRGLIRSLESGTER